MRAERFLAALLAAALAIVLLSCAPKVVSIPCVDAKDIPAEPAPIRDKLTGNAVTDSQLLAIAALEWKQYGLTTGALLRGCVG